MKNSDSKPSSDGPAFPIFVVAGNVDRRSITEMADGIREACAGGVTVRDYFIAHAPAEPQPWFEPVMPYARPKPSLARCEDRDLPANWRLISAYNDEIVRQRYIQWPGAWADEQLRQRGKA